MTPKGPGVTKHGNNTVTNVTANIPNTVANVSTPVRPEPEALDDPLGERNTNDLKEKDDEEEEDEKEEEDKEDVLNKNTHPHTFGYLLFSHDRFTWAGTTYKICTGLVDPSIPSSSIAS